MTPSTPAELLAAMERCGRATSGPWYVEANECAQYLWTESHYCLGECFGSSEEPVADSEFSAKARTDVPAQLALIAELLDVIEASAELLSHSDDCDTNSTRSADEIEADYHRPCDCMFHAVDTMAAGFTTPEWRDCAKKLREAR